MNPENTQKLYTDFPRLYRYAIANKRMHFGFECGDGWFQLIYRLSAQIEAEARELGFDPKSQKWPSALQVKEKLGTLKFYCAVGNRNRDGRGMVPSIRSLLMAAEDYSAEICERCGQPGELRTDGYWRVTCAGCEEKMTLNR